MSLAETHPGTAAPVARAREAHAGGANLALALRFALREMRRGLRGFAVFIACIALGVAAIAGVNAVALSITDGVLAEGRTILGGDVALRVLHRDFAPAERAYLATLGPADEVATVRAMVRAPDGAADAGPPLLSEVKAVDETYPLAGRFETSPPLTAAELAGYMRRDGADAVRGVVVDPILLPRLNVAVGDEVKIGSERFDVLGTIATEPDRVSDGFLFGPRVMMGRAAFDASGLVQPGSLIAYHTRVDLGGQSGEALKRTIEGIEEAFPKAGWRIRSRANAAPGLTRSIERFSQFLTLVGLTALIVGGVGVANATRAYLDTKREVIATFKSLGAPATFVFAVYLIQIMLIASVGIAIGLVLGSFMPPIAEWALQDLVPVAAGSLFQPSALLAGVAYGLLTALLFALWPLGQARDVPATALFRGGREDAPWPRRVFVIATALVLALLVGLAVWQAQSRELAAIFVGAIAFAFVLLRAVAWGIRSLARRAARLRAPVAQVPFAMAVGNIHRPGALTNSVVLSLGLGLALLVALALIDGNLRNQISANIPEDAPDFFFVDIQSADYPRFEAFAKERYDGSTLTATPMLRGRVVKLDGVPAEEAEIDERGRWVLRGDRGVTYSPAKPPNATLAEGEWWPENYAGEPLVSFAAEEGGELGLAIGDTLTVNVLGREITARVANLRNVEWESFGMNFLMVFSPNTFAGAPHQYLATLRLPKDGLGPEYQGGQNLARAETEAEAKRDAAVLRDVTDAFPTVTAIRVRDALTTVNGLVGQLATAIRAAAAVALIASVLVLAGALAAGNRARTHDAVILKTLGATRRTLIGAFVTEYSLLGLATALFALFAGAVSAWFVVAQVMGFRFVFDPAVAVGTIVAALVFTVGFGLVGTWRVLGQKAAPVLREL